MLLNINLINKIVASDIKYRIKRKFILNIFII